MTEKYFANCFLNSFEVLFSCFGVVANFAAAAAQSSEKKAIKQKLCCESILTVDSLFFCRLHDIVNYRVSKLEIKQANG